MYNNIIVVPVYNNELQIDYFMDAIAPKILKHMKNSKIVLVRQSGMGNMFNRGALLNIGCQLYENKTKNFILHDVYLEPLGNVINEYYAPDLVENDVRVIYSDGRALNGIIKVKHDAYFDSNGHSNLFWGCGYEDYDFKNRISFKKKNIEFIHIKPNYVSNDENISLLIDRNFIDYGNVYTSKTSFDNDKRIFVYQQFNKLNSTDKLEYIRSSGVNNIEYSIENVTKKNNSIESILVKI
jgi:hypothetical protein